MSEQPDRDGRHRDGRAKRGDTITLGLRVFEKISAVEGVSLTAQMRRDAVALRDERLREARKK